jgi:soluble lytic murein transglycosylase
MKKNNAVMRSIVIISILLLSVLCGLLFQVIWDAVDRATHPKEYSDYVEVYSYQYGVPEYVVYSVIKVESDFESGAVSDVGAVGLMQLMPETYEKDISAKIGHEGDASHLYDPETNIQAGVWYFSHWYAYYGTAVETLAAYHAGVGNVNKWREAGCVDEYGILDVDKIPLQGTQNYVNTVLYYKSQYDALYGSIAVSGKRIPENVCHEWALRYGSQYGVDSRLIMAIIRAESTFDPECLSSVGAKGLMQIMRSTYDEDIKPQLGLQESYADLHDGELNVMCGTYYLCWLSRYLTGTEQIIAAYNGGIGNVQRWLKNDACSADGETLIVENIPNEGVRNYVNKVMKYYEEYCARYPR